MADLKIKQQHKKRISYFSAQNSTCLIRNKVCEFLTCTHERASERQDLGAIRNLSWQKLLDSKVQTGTATPATNDNFVLFLFGSDSRTSRPTSSC